VNVKIVQMQIKKNRRNNAACTIALHVGGNAEKMKQSSKIESKMKSQRKNCTPARPAGGFGFLQHAKMPTPKNQKNYLCRH